MPRRHAPTWLLDDRGDVKLEFAADYVVKGRVRSVVSDAERQRDRVDAFTSAVADAHQDVYGRVVDVGEPLVLRVDAASAVVYPDAGGRLGQLDLGGGGLLRGPRTELDWASWGCYSLLPWSNRLPGGQLHLDGIDEHLPVNWPDGSAIHGLAATPPWTVVQASDHSSDLEVRVSAGPYVVSGTQSFVLGPEHLDLRLAATNEGDRNVPVGIGIHPWFRRGRVRVPADDRWPGEPLPTGEPVPVTGRYDLRFGGIPEPMDACFTSLTEPAVEVPGARLSWSGPVTNVVVFSGEPDWVCVEPVSMANDGFGLAARGVAGHGVQRLAPGATIEVRYRFERAASGVDLPRPG